MWTVKDIQLRIWLTTLLTGQPSVMLTPTVLMHKQLSLSLLSAFHRTSGEYFVELPETAEPVCVCVCVTVCVCVCHCVYVCVCVCV